MRNLNKRAFPINQGPLNVDECCPQPRLGKRRLSMIFQALSLSEAHHLHIAETLFALYDDT